uniref:PID domain-containing protein n=1 Tax=Panagrolaimus sp. JU765 TaxID=591449 RepID=A0AC34Q1X8_9BILA
MMYFLGLLEIPPIIPENNIANDVTRSTEERIVEHIECAQLAGNLAKTFKTCPSVSVNVSPHGIKILSISDQKVIDRIALHKVIEAFSYNDGFGNYNVALLIQLSRNTQNCYLFQSPVGETADLLCKNIKEAFSVIENMAQKTSSNQ